MDDRKIRYFIAVYEERSISRAAEREHVVQPAVSMQIKQLEQDFRIRLFERSPHGMEPTPAGDLFYRLCLDLAQGMRSMRQRMLDFGGELSGSLRIGVMPSICRGPLGAILAEFSTRHPAVEITVEEGTSGRLADSVHMGRLDTAVCNMPATQIELRCRLLTRNPVNLVARPGTGPAAAGRIGVADLEGAALILPTVHNSLTRQLLRHFQEKGTRPARVIHIDGISATLELVEGSEWMTLLPDIALRNPLDAGRFAVRPIADPEITSDIYEMHPSHRPLSRPAHELVRMIETILQAPEWESSRIR